MAYNLELPKMFQWQKDVFTGIKNNYHNTFHTIKSRRQVGKSILEEIMALYYALSHTKFKVYIITPTFSQCDKILNEIKDMVVGKPFYRGINAVRRQVFFKNESQIRLFSAEQKEALRGYNCQLLFIDEAAYIQDWIIDLVLPYVNVSGGPVVMFSTPKNRAGRFYEYYNMGYDVTQPTIFSYDWAYGYDMSELLPQSKLELYKKTMDALAFKTDYLGQFLDNESSVFGDYNSCIYQKPYFLKIKDIPVYVGIDWGSGVGGDYTAITVVDGNHNLIDLKYFNDKDPNETIEEIYSMLSKYNVKTVTVEMNSIGTVYCGLLQSRLNDIKTHPKLNKFITTNETKDKIISNLQVQIQNNNIKFFNDTELIDELNNYKMEFSTTGKRVFNASVGHHDDILMSLAMALNGINKGNYSIGFA